jgi:hypothetical protein
MDVVETGSLIERSFRILDADVSLSGPEPIAGPIAAAYARFETADPAGGGGARIAFAPGPGGTIRIDDRSEPVIESGEPVLQLYRAFLTTVFARLGRHALLHAAAVERAGTGGVLIAAPAGHGKSSLTMELVRRGFRFLGDDYAPVDPESGTVSPYPRTVGVVPGGSAPIPDEVRRVVDDPATPTLFGKALVDPGRAFGEAAMSGGPAPVRHVIALTSQLESSRGPETTWLDVWVRGEAAARLREAVDAVDGVDVVESREGPEVHAWRLRLEHARRPTPALSPVLEDEAVLYTEKFWDARPTFDGRPEAHPVKRGDAATHLGREMLNRRRGCRFVDRYEGDVVRLYVDLVGSLTDARCWCVRVGRFEETVDLLESLVA